MGKEIVQKTYEEINARIKAGEAVVVTAEEMVEIVRAKGPEEAARTVDVVTTGTFSPMCSSGMFFNFGQMTPTIKASKVWVNKIPAYAGLAAVDSYIGATEPTEDDPLNKVYPGEFRYGGGHVIEDLVAGRSVLLEAKAYGTDCYKGRKMKKEITLDDLPYAMLCNPRNGYQNYNCAVNLSDKTVYTYMGMLKANGRNANYCSAGALSPLFNDPHYRTIGMGTRIFLGGGVGYVTWHGTQHNPNVPRTEGGVPRKPAGTMMVQGDLKQMSEKWLRGVSILGYGSSLAVGLGVPIPILNAEMAAFTGVSDDDLVTQVVDYGHDYTNGIVRSYGEVSYAQLMTGQIEVNGKKVQTAPLSSRVKARQIAEELKGWIKDGRFYINRPAEVMPDQLG
ncbi:MAG: homocysteine biosynthesis protein [Desulfobulbaceae bacterium]|uniref:Homocysteine biosynthesis protein n=1 Tax=Candidatus Desulfatifera sulfidica TaxID=2841691 RepID=A0A8J6N6S5_9BACT|nr:homocysteine biosynthesis protein [Candidatus Desulfatifera sulfidica]